MKKKIALTAFIVAVFAFFVINTETVVSEIDDSDIFDFYGFAWSENIGWISFNSESDGSVNDYSVTVGFDGNVRGYGWSEHIGWIKFDGLSNFPESPGYSAKVDIDGYLPSCEEGHLCGWARALSGRDQDDGWDGWINFNAGDNGVRFTDGSTMNSELLGWAWGSDVVGWISTSCENEDNDCSVSDYRIETDFEIGKPTVENDDSSEPIRIIQGDYCHRSEPVVYSGWEYESPVGIDQGGFQVQIVNRGDSFDGEGYEPKTGNVDSCNNCILPGDGTYWEENAPYSENNTYMLPGDFLNFDSRYTIRVQVWDKYGMRSDWQVKDFKTRIRYPEVYFNFNPPTPLVDEVTYFNDQTDYHDWLDPGNRDGDIEMEWIFENGDPDRITGIYDDITRVTTVFTESGSNPVTLRISAEIRDESEGEVNYIYESCESVRLAGTRMGLPDWQEINPF